MSTRIWVDPWDPSFGSSVTDGTFDETTAKLTLDRLELTREKVRSTVEKVTG